MGTIYHKKKIFGGNPLIETIGVGGGYAPIGTIIAYMGTTAPQDYLACDGSTYNITDYKQLARFIETQFGSINYFGGDGTTTFAVPDLRGEFLRGTGTNSHTDSGNGSSVGTHQMATKIPRFATASQTGAPITYGKGLEPTLVDFLERSTENKYYYFPGGSVSEGTATTPVKIFSSRPTNTSVLYCIKAVVAGDVYSTDERVVGTWIDGKPIYQKTFKYTTATSGSAVADVGTISNCDIAFVVDGFYINKNSTFGTVDSYFMLTNTGRDIEKVTFTSYVYITNSGTVRVIFGSTTASEGIYVTVKYTKTTD